MNLILRSSASVFALGLASSLHASVLLLDFGPTSVSGTDRTVSPYHTVNNTFTDTTWNQVQTTDISSGLLWSDNSAATGVTINLGATTTAGVTTLGLATTPGNNSALATTTNTGVYAGTSVGRDAIFQGTSSGQSRAVGLQVGGLSAGTYDLYITARNTNSNSTYSQNIRVGVSSAAGDFDFSAYALETLTYTNGATAVSAWTEDANYLRFSISLTAGQYLNIASIGGATVEQRGFLNSIQIVDTTPVPEPATAAALLGLAALGFAISRRRRAS